MVKRGVDVHVIQSILGHRSVLTTLRYLDSYDFSPHARREVQKALEHIRANRREQEKAPKPVARERFEKGGVVFATGLALCKDVFDPPDNIRRATGIRRGAPCSLFNMCLRCPNVLILEDHLPSLFALRRQYLTALEQGLSATTHRTAVQQNLHVLNNLLDAEKSDWPEDVLLEAERRSEFVDTVADPVTIRGVAG
jgi:integrase